jgi:hypothetical protein
VVLAVLAVQNDANREDLKDRQGHKERGLRTAEPFARTEITVTLII